MDPYPFPLPSPPFFFFWIGLLVRLFLHAWMTCPQMHHMPLLHVLLMHTTYMDAMYVFSTCLDDIPPDAPHALINQHPCIVAMCFGLL